ncbi:pepsin/retropepsin-like aspartic protease family protein [Luteimonas terrae]|uniref:Aspartyl protease n=1 Tax=Luteimonas terrae TaxID=1530191 RepID=A0ABU1Y1F8_9GAMM|nr:pepsin/retropepsin-like aspartic protease family protein [Luteimonas terrae]MDR7194783.1 putative aspartyl protease [Luteimonas terrae]
MTLSASAARAGRFCHARDLAFAVCALFGACAAHAAAPLHDACALALSASDALVDVPFDLVDGRVYVAAQVDGAGPFRFAIDTGASGVARADTRLAEALGLPREGSAANSDGVSTAQADTFRLRSLTLGTLRHEDVVVITRDYNARQSADATFDGILAREFFADGLLAIDYPRRRLSFSRVQRLTVDQPGTLAYERPFRIPVSIGDLQLEAQLDTGANVTLVLPQAHYDVMPDAAAMTQDRLTLSNGDIDGGRARLRGPLRIGALSLSDFEVRVSTRFPEALVGAHALQDSVVLIDQRSQRVAVCAPTPGTP